MNKSTQTELKVSSVVSPKGVFLVTHGLNNKPEVMQELISLLNLQSYSTVLVTFSGHESGAEWGGNHSMDRWLGDLQRGYCKAKAEFPNLKIYGLGYSLGGTLLLASTNRFSDLNFEKFILFAPAIKLKPKTRLLKFLTLFSFTGISLPSLAPLAYRAHDHTPLQAYNALFDAICSILNLQKSEIPTLIFLREKDEMIDFAATKSWAASSLSKVTIFPIRNRQDNKLPQHLIIDSDSCEKSEWSIIISEIQKLLIS